MIKKNKKSGTALITGGAKRIGAELALYLAQKKYDLVISYHQSHKEVQDLQQKIMSKYDVACDLIRSDLTDIKQIWKLGKEISKNYKNWNLLINNASIFLPDKFLDDDKLEKFQSNFALHLQAPMILSQIFGQHCLKHKNNGNIINMIDKNIVRYETKYFNYILSKKFLAEFTKMAALQLAPQIRVNAIAPGFILPSAQTGFDRKKIADFISKIPLQKKGNKASIIKAADYLLNNDFVTGKILFIDGGANLNHSN